MSSQLTASASFKDSKPHFLLLDALRGVAALIVIWYHCYEGFATSIVTQGCNHGYLAVDFFFILSGFVIGYAYDDRLSDGTLTTGGFFKRRLIRLHPMVVFGAIFGLVCFLIQGGQAWDGTKSTAGLAMLALLFNMFLIPLVPGQRVDVRGNGEMFPLNGPHWSLFFEYVGNILYVLLLRKLPTRILACLTAVLGVVLSYIVISNGYLGIGWTLPDFWGGLVRMLFPYCAGMLLSRLFMRRKALAKASRLPEWMRRHSFLICTVALLALLPQPFIGNEDHLWQNGLYVTVIILLVFPALVWLAATGSECSNSPKVEKFARLLGDLSFPLYAVHYPVMYMFYSYIGFPNVTTTMASQWPVALGVAAFNIVFAYIVLKLYDIPVRRCLARRLMTSNMH